MQYLSTQYLQKIKHKSILSVTKQIVKRRQLKTTVQKRVTYNCFFQCAEGVGCQGRIV